MMLPTTGATMTTVAGRGGAGGTRRPLCGVAARPGRPLPRTAGLKGVKQAAATSGVGPPTRLTIGTGAAGVRVTAMMLAAASTMTTTMGVLWMGKGGAMRMKGYLTALLRVLTWTVMRIAIATAAELTPLPMLTTMVAGDVASRPPSGMELAAADVTAPQMTTVAPRTRRFAVAAPLVPLQARARSAAAVAEVVVPTSRLTAGGQ